MSLFVDLKRLFYTKDETDTNLNTKEDTSNKVTSISSSSTDTEYPSAKLLYDQLDTKLNSKIRATTTFSPQNYGNGTNCTWNSPYSVTISNGGYLTLDFSQILDKVEDRVYFNITTNQNISVEYDSNIYSSTDTKSMFIMKNSNNYTLHLYNNDDFSGYVDTFTKDSPTITITPTTSNSTEISFGKKMWYHYVSYIDRVYPIGSIYMSVNSVDPTYFIGGTWERIQDKFLLASGSTYTAGNTGGASTVALTKAQMPRHNHTQAQHRHAEHGKWSSASGSDSGYMYSSNRTVSTQYTEYATPTINHTGGTGTTNADANGSPHENMPPYLAVYMWKRIG